MSSWIVVTDFDGTLTRGDVGNELCLEVIPALFEEQQRLYRAGKVDLKDYQKTLWSAFPMSESRFRERALAHGALRPGVSDFFDFCAKRDVPVYVASCGLRPYIETVLEKRLSRAGLGALKEIRCNEARFGAAAIAEFTPPPRAPDCPYPLDKGAFSAEMRQRHGDARILGIGNGTSDRSFIGHVHHLAATEALAGWCARQGHAHTAFDDFTTLLPLLESLLK